MKKILEVSLLTIAALSFTPSINAQEVTSQKATVPPQKVSLLFVQVAQSATLSANTLTLLNVDPKTLWFSDRPVRKAGVIETGAFIQKWKTGSNSFQQNNPNAALTDITLEAKNLVEITPKAIELSHPIYNSSKHSLTYQVKFLNKNMAPTSAKQFMDVSLFIDNNNGPDSNNSFISAGTSGFGFMG